MARQIEVEIVGDASKFKNATEVASGSATKMGAVIGAVSGVVAGVVMKGIDAVVSFGTEAVALGPKFEAMDAKAQTVFGNTLGVVKAWAEANAAAMGLTGREAIGLAANMGDLLVPMGFTREQAAGMSTDMVGLSGALSEWSGGTKTAAEVASSLQKALLGEREELKSLGISITEADVKQQLMKDGTDQLTGAALAQAKAQATQTLIFEKSTDAQAAYAAGTAAGIRSQHEMDASLNTVKETLVTALYPILQSVTKVLAEALPVAIGIVSGAFTALAPIGEIVGRVFSEIGGLIDVFGGASEDMVEYSAAMVQSTSPIQVAFGLLGGAIAFVTGTVIPALGAAFSWIRENILPPVMAIFRNFSENILPVLKLAFMTIVNVVRDNWPTISEIAGMVGNAVKTAFQVISTIIGIVGPIIKAIATVVFPAVGAAAGVLLTVIKTVFGAIGVAAGIFSGVFTTVQSTVSGILGALTGGFNAFASNVSYVWSRVSGAVRGAVNAVIGAVNGLIRAWNNISFTMPRIDLPFGGSVGGFTIGTPNIGYIPYLHAGGIVPGLPGSNVLSILQAGERVTPANAAAGVTIIFNGPVVSDAAELSRLLANELRLSGAL